MQPCWAKCKRSLQGPTAGRVQQFRCLIDTFHRLECLGSSAKTNMAPNSQLCQLRQQSALRCDQFSCKNSHGA